MTVLWIKNNNMTSFDSVMHS